MIEGKISVVHYLNVKLKSKGASKKSAEYPLYVRIRFNGVQTEIKSNFFLFFDDDQETIHDPVKGIGLSMYRNLTEAEFKNPSKDLALHKAIEKERIAILTIVDFFRSENLNVITSSPKFIIERCITLAETMVSEFAKYEMQDFLLPNNFFQIHAMIDWATYFPNIFEGIQLLTTDGKNQTKFKRILVDEFETHYHLIKVLRGYADSDVLRVYHWATDCPQKAKFLLFLRGKEPRIAEKVTKLLDRALNHYLQVVRQYHR